MKRIFSLIIAAMCVIAAYSQGAGWKYSGSTAWPGVVRDWNTATYDQFHLVNYEKHISTAHESKLSFWDNTWECGGRVATTCSWKHVNIIQKA